MWESPIYKFERIIDDPETGKPKTETFTIDVTGSAPTMLVPGQQLVNVFDVITKDKEPDEIKILDFGAAKLRNTLHLLENNFHVYAVEFKQVYEKPQGKEFLEKCLKYKKNFHEITFPDEFYNLKEKFDFILMINVLNVMPIYTERLCALSLCKNILKDDGKLLIYHMRAAASDTKKYSEKNKLNDGWMTNRTHKIQNFYVEPNKREIFEMAKATGYNHDINYKLSGISGSNYSFVFSPNDIALLDNVLCMEDVKKGGKKHNLNIPIHEIKNSSIFPLYVTELESVTPGRGKGDAKKFHRLASRILAGIFEDQLGEPRVEIEINEGLGRIDIVFENKMENGFFKRLQNQVNCPLISVECKNYSKDIENPEFAQLSSRLNDQRGQFGILVCRGVKDKKKILQHCKSLLKKGEHIIVIDDDDLKNLVQLKLDDGIGAVNDFMSDKHSSILL